MKGTLRLILGAAIIAAGSVCAMTLIEGTAYAAGTGNGCKDDGCEDTGGKPRFCNGGCIDGKDPCTCDDNPNDERTCYCAAHAS